MPARLWALPFWTALAVADGIESTTGLRVALQWPNDLLLEGRKCCGILCISRVAGPQAWAACGVGINVLRPASDESLAAIQPPPAFLSDFAPPVARETLLGAILARLRATLARSSRDPQRIERAWERRADLAGTPYRLLVDGEAEPIESARATSGRGRRARRRRRRHATRSIALADARVLR